MLVMNLPNVQDCHLYALKHSAAAGLIVGDEESVGGRELVEVVCYLLNSWRVSPPPKNFCAVRLRSIVSSILLVPCQKAGIRPMTAFTNTVLAFTIPFCTSGASKDEGSTSRMY